MNIKEIKEILNLMKEHSLSEIEIEKEGMKLVVRKNSSGQIVMQQPAMTTVPAAANSSDNGGTSEVAPSGGKSAGATEVNSPMVGTFYNAPAPDQPPYVSVGQSVSEGDVLCIIEAMKLMNEIKAETSGIIEKILVSNGEAVEFDQPLFYIK